MSEIIPFTWDGRRYNGQPDRKGVIVFQRVSKSMNDAHYFMRGKALRGPGDDLTSGYHFDELFSPRMDSTMGV